MRYTTMDMPIPVYKVAAEVRNAYPSDKPFGRARPIFLYDMVEKTRTYYPSIHQASKVIGYNTGNLGIHGMVFKKRYVVEVVDINEKTLPDDCIDFLKRRLWGKNPAIPRNKKPRSNPTVHYTFDSDTSNSNDSDKKSE